MPLLLWSRVQADRSYIALPSPVAQVGRKRYRPIWCPLRRSAATTPASPMLRTAIDDSYLLYLDALRETDATTNMRVVGAFLKPELDATCREATDLLKHWAQTFGALHQRL